MKVQFNESIASATFSYRINEVAEINDALAQCWIISGVCKAVVEEEAPKKPAKTK